MKPYYEHAGIAIYHGDCLSVLAQSDWYYDHVITDPPYFRDVYLRAGMPKTKKGSGTPSRTGASLKKLAAGDIGDVDGTFQPLSAAIGRKVRRWVLVFSDVENAHRWRNQLESVGLRYVRTGAWVKPDAMPQMSGDRPSVGFEPCTIAHASGPMRWNGGGRQALWTYYISKGLTRPDHPCPKPEPLMVQLVTDFTDSGETILDPFMGSGTTLVAAKRLGRKAIGIEREEKYCEIAAKRLQQEALPLEVA